MDESNKLNEGCSLIKTVFEFIKSISPAYAVLSIVANPDDLSENIQYFYDTPNEFDEEFTRMVTHGFTLKETHDLLKETYNF